MDFKDIAYGVEHGIATIRMNRPEYRNAQSYRMLDEIDAGFARAKADKNVRVLIVRGSGGNFSAGHDLGTEDALAYRKALGAAPEPQRLMEDRGLNAARLRAAKVLARRHLTDANLSSTFVAGRLGISVRSLQRLFEQTGTTFSAFVVRERLAKAYEILKKGRGSRGVAEIALDSGFGDVSYFNRKFRALYRATPSEIQCSASGTSDVTGLPERC